MSAAITAIERLYRRVLMVVGRGRIKTGRDDGAAQVLQVRLGAMGTIDNLPRLAEYGFNSMPPADTDAIVLFAGGNRSDGVIVATGSQQYRMRSLKLGEVSISDDQGQSVFLTRGGIVIDGGGLPIKVTNAPTITLDSPTVHATGDMIVDGDVQVTGNVDVQGAVAAQGDVSDNGGKTMAAMRSVFNGHNHVVANVQGGSSSVTSATPGQKE